MKLTITNHWVKASWLLVTLCFWSTAAISQTLNINKGRFQIDKSSRLIVCNQLPKLDSLSNQIYLDRLYTFTNPTSQLTLGQRYVVMAGDTTYDLIFTKFPIVTINTNNVAITTDAVTKGTFTLIDTLGRFGRSDIGINVRGAYTSTLPKKPFKVEFFTDSRLQTTKDTSLLGMRSDSEWLLLAMFNEPTRINNVTSHALWLKIHQLYYIKQEPDAFAGIHTRYVDVFANGKYLGIYALTEPLDRKQLKLKKSKDNGQVRGELYKAYDWTSATLFNGVTPEVGNQSIWGGFEIKYPNDTAYWAGLQELIDFTAKSSESDFKNQIFNKLQIDNVVDYFLFLNLVRATDNRGKNVYIARYKENDPYIFVPWDLDGTWGYMWAGARDGATDDIMSNGLFDRLLALNPGGFRQKLKKRWFKLRESEFAPTTLKSAITANINVLQQDGAYLRESTQWPLESIDAELAYVQNWVDRRVAYLDTYFGSFLEECTNATAPTLSVSSTVVTAGTAVTLTASGCPYTVIWSTGQSGKQVTITPTAGVKYTATCYQPGADCSSPASLPISVSVVSTSNLTAKADLALSLVANRRLAAVNEAVEMTIVLTNNGPQTAYNVQLQERLPIGLSFMSSSVDGLSHVNNIVNVKLDSIADGETRLIPFVVKPVIAGTFINAVQVLATTTPDVDSRPGSGTGDGEDDMAFIDLRTAEASTVVNVSPNPNQQLLPEVVSNEPARSLTETDLRVDIVSSKRVVHQGQTISLTLLVSNDGKLDATNVSIDCFVPTGLEYVDGSGFVSDGSRLTVSGLTVPAGAKLPLVIVLKAVSGGSLTCKAQILTCDQTDSDSSPGNGYESGDDDEAAVDLRVIDN